MKREHRECHVCGEWSCPICHQQQEGHDHFCSMRATERKVPSLHHLYFDFECEQDSGQHIPNFLVAETTCDHCKDQVLDKEATCTYCGNGCDLCNKRGPKTKEFACAPCTGCGNRYVTFEGINCHQQFSEWLFTEQHRGMTAIAHNARGYDAYFLLDYLLNNTTAVQMVPQIIYRGSKILSMHLKEYDIRVIDSLSFFPMKLSALPKAFGLPIEGKKGHFPHFFNRRENWTYHGPYPPPDDYGADQMMEGERKAFYEWYNTLEGQTFHFREELESYCHMDVEVLRQACLKFRDIMIEITMDESGSAIDPFSYVTIPSVCMAIFKSMFLQEEWEVVTHEESSLAASEQRSPKKMHVTKKGGQYHGVEVKDMAEKSFVQSDIVLSPYKGYAFSGKQWSPDSILWLEWMQLSPHSTFSE